MNRLTLKNRINKHRLFKSSRKKQLIGAIIDNNIRLVNALINNGVNINYQDDNKNTPLIIALLNDKIDIANILLSRPDIDVNLQNSQGNTALMIAINEDKYKIVEKLLEIPNIDLNIQNNRGDTAFFNALFHSIRYKKNYMINLLVSRPDIDVNLQNEHKDTILTLSIFNKLDNLTKKLLERDDIDVNLQTTQGNTALILASERNVEIVKLLLAKPNINVNIQNTNYGNTALIVAKGPDANKIVEALLEMPDIDVNIQNNKGNTVLIYAIEGNKTEVIKLLLERDDIDVNLKSEQGNTALIIATSKNNTELVEALLERDDIDLNLQSEQGNIALFNAIHHNNIQIVKLLLLKPGIDINFKNNQGVTPLINAISINSNEIVKALLEMPNIDVNLKDNNGFSALINATHKNNTYMVKALLEKPDIDVNIQTNNGFTPLLNSTHHNNIEIVKLLLLKPEINVNLENNNGITPLFHSIVKHNDEIIKLLIGKKVKIKNEYIDLYIDHGGNDEYIKKYLENQNMRIKWKGFTKSLVQIIDSIFAVKEITGQPPEKDLITAANGSLCPICLTYVYRTDGCMYMSHDCKVADYYHKDLYKKYSYTKNGQKIVEWCTVCSRICDNHKHLPLLKVSDPKPNPNTLQVFYAFGDDCIGKGGGGLLEKLSRFIEYKTILVSLQDQVGKISRDEGYKTLIEGVWNAPLNGIPETLDKPPGWDAASEIFPEKLPENTEEAPDIPPPDYLVAPTSAKGTNNIMGVENEDIIIFTHKQKDGSIKNHSYPVGDFVNFIRTNNPERPNFGICMYTPSCNSCLHPEEVRIVSEDLEKLDHVLYEKYKKDYNKFFENKESPCHEFIGGRKAMTRTNTRRNRRFRKTRSKKRA